MKNSNSQNDSQVFECVLDGFVYRGSRSYIQQVIADWRENHD